MVIRYEDFVAGPAEVVETLRSFLSLQAPMPVPEVAVDSLSKWRQQLSDDDVRQIEGVVGFPPPPGPA
jgi:hypothetical protein